MILNDIENRIKEMSLSFEIEKGEVNLSINTTLDIADVLPKNMKELFFNGTIDNKEKMVILVKELVENEFPYWFNEKTEKNDIQEPDTKINQKEEDVFDIPEETDEGLDKKPSEEIKGGSNREEATNKNYDIPPIPGFDDDDTTEEPEKGSAPPPPKEKPSTEKTEPKKEETGQAESEPIIKDVQILAINTQLELNNADYKQLVKEAFEQAGIEVNEIPPIEKLTYRQAIEVIKYGNQKFKK